MQAELAVRQARLRAEVFALLTPEQQAQAEKFRAERGAAPVGDPRTPVGDARAPPATWCLVLRCRLAHEIAEPGGNQLAAQLSLLVGTEPGSRREAVSALEPGPGQDLLDRREQRMAQDGADERVHPQLRRARVFPPRRRGGSVNANEEIRQQVVERADPPLAPISRPAARISSRPLNTLCPGRVTVDIR